jgi:hypothetical protein
MKSPAIQGVGALYGYGVRLANRQQENVAAGGGKQANALALR